MYVCGQNNIRERLTSLIDRDKFPRFCIFVAPHGYGKKVMCEWVSKKLDSILVPCSISIDSVRETIYNAYNITSKMLYMFFDADEMSVGAKNALLKVTEEPPNNAYFIMTVENLSNVLPTILSRATVFTLENYSLQDLKEYVLEKQYTVNTETEKVMYQISTCPKDITTCISVDILGIYNLADKFVQNIGLAKIYNEFKISQSLAIKGEEDKFDPVLFMRCVMLVCNETMLQPCNKEDCQAYAKIIKNTSKYLSEFLQKGSSKQLVIDNWILNTHLDISGGTL